MPGQGLNSQQTWVRAAKPGIMNDTQTVRAKTSLAGGCPTKLHENMLVAWPPSRPAKREDVVPGAADSGAMLIPAPAVLRSPPRLPDTGAFLQFACCVSL